LHHLIKTFAGGFDLVDYGLRPNPPYIKSFPRLGCA
jgi:hypothetical protein